MNRHWCICRASVFIKDFSFRGAIYFKLVEFISLQGVLFEANRAQVLVSEVVFSPFMALFVICFCMSVNSSPSFCQMCPCSHLFCKNGWVCRHMHRSVVLFTVLLCSSCIGDEIGWIASEIRYYWSISSSYSFPVFPRKSSLCVCICNKNPNIGTLFWAFPAWKLMQKGSVLLK